MTTEQLTRLLTACEKGGQRELGLAEKINFEVTLLKASRPAGPGNRQPHKGACGARRRVWRIPAEGEKKRAD